MCALDENAEQRGTRLESPRNASDKRKLTNEVSRRGHPSYNDTTRPIKPGVGAGGERRDWRARAASASSLDQSCRASMRALASNCLCSTERPNVRADCTPPAPSTAMADCVRFVHQPDNTIDRLSCGYDLFVLALKLPLVETLKTFAISVSRRFISQ